MGVCSNDVHPSGRYDFCYLIVHYLFSKLRQAKKIMCFGWLHESGIHDLLIDLNDLPVKS